VQLLYHYDFLKANPDVKIQFGFSKKDVLASFVLPFFYFQWLGMYDRLINGTVYAKEVYLPREGGCQDPGYNAWEVGTLKSSKNPTTQPCSSPSLHRTHTPSSFLRARCRW